MEETRLVRELDLPRVIVWEALVDPVLVGGWLHPHARLLDGEQREFRPPEGSSAAAVLEMRSAEFGAVRVELHPLAGGTRGEATRLTLRVADDRAGHVDRSGVWTRRLDQLEELLRGHPVDWIAQESAHTENGRRDPR